MELDSRAAAKSLDIAWEMTKVHLAEQDLGDDISKRSELMYLTFGMTLERLLFIIEKAEPRERKE